MDDGPSDRRSIVGQFGHFSPSTDRSTCAYNARYSGGSRRRSRSSDPGKRSTCGLVTVKDGGGFTEVLISGSPTVHSEVERCPRPERHCRQLKSINWYVDLNDVSRTTDFREPTTKLGTSSLQRHQGNGRTGAGTKLSPNDSKTKLEPESFDKTTQRDASNRQGRKATRQTPSSDHICYHDATSTAEDEGKIDALLK